MASNRNPLPSRQGAPLKPHLAKTLHPSTSAPPRPKLHESDFRPRLSDPPLRPKVHDSAGDAASNVTPRSSSRKSRVDSSPQASHGDDTPSHARKRPLMTSPTNSEPAAVRRPPVATNKAKSVVGSSRPTAGNTSRNAASTTARPTVRGFVKTPDAVKPPTSGFGSHLSAPSTATPLPPRPSSSRSNSTKDTSPMFFHANDAKSQAHSHEKPPPLKKKSSFLYANGHHKDVSPKPVSYRSTSPVPSAVSAVSESRPRHLFIQSPPSSEPALTPPLVSPPLSAVSSRSAYFPTPNSPPKNNIHLSYRKGVSQIFGLGGPLPFHPAQPTQPTQRKSSLVSVRSAHGKSNSLSSIDTSSPDHIRRQSHPLPHLANPSALHESIDSPTPSAPPNINTVIDAVMQDDAPQSPTKPPLDIHAEARRERKVLDLEISNSSLLAINKSLERELRKQKAELKRFRRMSRAGQFAVPQREPSVDDLSALGEEADLPDFDQDDEGARPSSPFLEQASDDFSDADSTGSSAVPHSPTTRAERDAVHRAEDENRLRLDLSRHRELLLDTQRMNQSLQRCLYWTESLIGEGKKALEYQITPSDVKLGGHILSADDLDEGSSQVDYAESVEEQPNQQPDPQVEPGGPDRRSVGSEMDSGIDLGKRPLLMSRENPNFSRPSPRQS